MDFLIMYLFCIMKKYDAFELYIDYLITNNRQATATELSALTDNQLKHDYISDLPLNTENKGGRYNFIMTPLMAWGSNYNFITASVNDLWQLQFYNESNKFRLLGQLVSRLLF